MSHCTIEDSLTQGNCRVLFDGIIYISFEDKEKFRSELNKLIEKYSI